MLSIPIISEPQLGGVPRRSSFRQRIETLVYADLGPGNGGFPINISEGGMAFQGIRPLETGRVLSIRFKLPGTGESVETIGQVAWLNELGKGGGLQFIDLSRESRDLVCRWLSQQSQPQSYSEDSFVGVRRVEEKENQPFSAFPSETLDGNASNQTEANSILPLQPDVLHSATATEATASRKSTAEIPMFADIAQAKIQEARGKRTWIMPFAVGLFAFAVLTIAVMSFYGLISVQFHWPQKIANETPARSRAESEVAKVSESRSETAAANIRATDRSAPGPAALIVPPATNTQVPAATSIQPGSTTAKLFPERAATAAKVNSSKASLQLAATAKPMAPTRITPATPAEFVPPSFALPAKSELAPQLPMISTQPSAPAPLVNTPSRQAGKLEAAQIIKRKDPIYPTEAKATGMSGSVELQFTITVEGNVRDVSAVRGNPVLVRSAVEAVKTWRYQPARLGGNPVESQSTTIINFRPN